MQQHDTATHSFIMEMFRKTVKKGGKVVSDSGGMTEVVRAKRPRPAENPPEPTVEDQSEKSTMGLVFVKPQGSLEALREKHKERFIDAKLADPALESVLNLVPKPLAPGSDFSAALAADNDDPEAIFAAAKRFKTSNTDEYKTDKINWVTGLIEVPLSMKHKLDNIEATEQAKRRLFYDNRVEESRFGEIHSEEYEHFNDERLKAKKEEREYEQLEALMFGKSRQRRKALERKRKENAMAEAISQAECRDSS